MIFLKKSGETICTVLFLTVHMLYYNSYDNFLGISENSWLAISFINIYTYLIILLRKTNKYIGIPIMIWFFSLIILNIISLYRDKDFFSWFCNSKIITFIILSIILISLIISLFVNLKNKKKCGTK